MLQHIPLDAYLEVSRHLKPSRYTCRIWTVSFIKRMKFPLINITEEDWSFKDWLENIDFDGYFYTRDPVLFEKYAFRKRYCDCTGNMYEVVGKTPPTGWRNYLRFLPYVYREKIEYLQTDKRMELSELRNYMVQKVEQLQDNPFQTEMISSLQAATTYEDIMTTV